ncbi:MAG: Holliday junction branch migration protein RuvA [Halobacteriovoraceae bacterium]|nr:Holliday junction branch migration protein RuvA [Halobacteriovoraceae bacterium]
MIGFLAGEVVFSDGNESILKTKDGVGYQVFFRKLLVEGTEAEVFVSHVFKDPNQELFGFESLRDKKLFELLTSVKGVGPKSAYSLLIALGSDTIIQSVQLENKKALSQAPGIGAKAAAQICLDLSQKIQNVLMFSNTMSPNNSFSEETHSVTSLPLSSPNTNSSILSEALMACKELGFKEDLIISKAQKILSENEIQKPEQLVHLVLKEL